MKKVLLILLFVLFFVTGCSSSGYHYWELGDTKPDFVPNSGEGTIYFDTDNFDLYRFFEEEWVFLANIKGQPGKDGTVSNIYIDENGFFVVDGVVSTTKVHGLDGKDGVSGIDGKPGKDGIPGKNGKDGKDGISPKITTTADGYLAINDIKSTLKVKNPNRVCKVTFDFDDNMELSVGDEVQCGTESFNIISITDEKVVLFSKYNLDVGYTYDYDTSEYSEIESPTGLQQKYAVAWNDTSLNYGVVPFSSENYWDNGNIKGIYNDEYPGSVYDSNTFAFNYIQEYKKKLSSIGLNAIKTRLITTKELSEFGCDINNNDCSDTEHEYLYNTSYWTGTAYDYEEIYIVYSDGWISSDYYYSDEYYGVRPVIEIDRSDLSDDAFIDLLYQQTYCVYDGELEPGTVFYKGQYAYMYTYNLYDGELELDDYYYDPTKDGWMVKYVDSSKLATGKICKTINGKPLTSTAMMYDNSGVEYIDLSTLDTSNVTHMSSMFSDIAVNNLIFGDNFNTSNVVDMNGMFANLNIEKIDLSNFNTKNVTNMNSMFFETSVNDLDLSSFDTSNVISMISMFELSDINNIKFGNNFNTKNVTNMSSMFESSEMTSLDLSSFNTSKVTDMSMMFGGSKATSIKFGNNFNTSNVKNMGEMFAYSSVLSLDLSKFNTSNVTNMWAMFISSNVTNLDLSSFDTSKVSIMKSMFENSKATVINIDNFSSESLKDMSYMFSESKVKNIKLNMDTSNITDMSYMFYGSEATSFDGNNFVISSGTNILSMFENSSLETIKGVKFDKYSASGMFSGSKAHTLTFIDCDTSKFTDISKMFAKSSISKVVGLETSNVTNMSYLFNNSTATTLDLSNFDTSNVIYMNDMFSYSKATQIDISSFDTSNVTNMSSMFLESMLTELDLSHFKFNDNTNLEFFLHNSQITNVNFGDITSTYNTYYYGDNVLSGKTKRLETAKFIYECETCTIDSFDKIIYPNYFTGYDYIENYINYSALKITIKDDRGYLDVRADINENKDIDIIARLLDSNKNLLKEDNNYTPEYNGGPVSLSFTWSDLSQGDVYYLDVNQDYKERIILTINFR